MHRLLVLLIIAFSVTSCASRKVHRLTDQKFEPTPQNQEVKLFVNAVRRPHIQLAYIDSFYDSADDTEVLKRQLADIRKKARKLGADAIVNVRQLNSEVRGFTVDESVPFKSYEQGEYELTFVRGTAVKFVEENDERIPQEEIVMEDDAPESVPTDSGIPTIKTADPNEGQTTLPRGLNPNRR